MHFEVCIYMHFEVLNEKKYVCIYVHFEVLKKKKKTVSDSLPEF